MSPISVGVRLIDLGGGGIASLILLQWTAPVDHALEQPTVIGWPSGKG